jgi:MerR family transcriptional regulator/heat shock protein HspR
MPDRDEPVYIISIAARMCEMHPQTLRQYERLGLVRPRRVGNNRLYSQADIERLRQIQRFTQEMGINLAGVEVILDLLDRMEQMTRDAEQHARRMQERMEREIERARAEVEAHFERRQRAKQLVPVSEQQTAAPARKIPIKDITSTVEDSPKDGS